MLKIKSIHALLCFGRHSGLPTELFSFCRVRNRGRFARASNLRADKVPAEYEAKVNRANEAFGAPWSTAVVDAPKAFPTVRGLALGAFGEFGESINVLSEVMTHESALKLPCQFGQSNNKTAFGQIHFWWLKRRWAHLAVITAVEPR